MLGAQFDEFMMPSGQLINVLARDGPNSFFLSDLVVVMSQLVLWCGPNDCTVRQMLIDLRRRKRSNSAPRFVNLELREELQVAVLPDLLIRPFVIVLENERFVREDLIVTDKLPIVLLLSDADG